MSKKFVGKVAVVTGGSTGMGLATAKRFVQEGMDQVFITGRGQGALDAAAAEIGKNVTAVPGDVSNLADPDRLYDTVKKHERKIDIIVANAGLARLARFGTVWQRQGAGQNLRSRKSLNSQEGSNRTRNIESEELKASKLSKLPRDFVLWLCARGCRKRAKMTHGPVCQDCSPVN